MKRNSLLSNCQSNYYQILVSFSASSIVISYGMHYAWTAPIIPILQSKNSPIPITKTQAGWLESIYLLSGIAFLPFTITLLDYFGRRKSILCVSFMYIVSWLFLLFGNRVEYLYVGRSIAGMAGDLCMVATEIYNAEISNEKIRGFLSSTVILMLLIGILLMYSIAPFVAFYIPSLIGLSVASIHLVIFTFMPESPYYFLLKNKKAEAKKVLNILRPANQNIEFELETMRAAIQEQQENKGKLRDLFTKNHNLKVVGIATILIAAQHLCGYTVILMNIHTILSVGNDGKSIYFSSSTTAILFSAVMLFSSVIAACYTDKYGRKVLLVMSCAFTTLCLLSLAVYFNLLFLGYNMEKFNLIPVISMVVYAFVFKVGLGTIPFILMPEMYATNVKAIGLSLGDVLYLLFAYIAIEFYQRVSDAYGIYVVFYSFTGFMFVIFILIYLLVPETKGKTLEEIQTVLKSTSSANARFRNNI